MRRLPIYFALAATLVLVFLGLRVGADADTSRDRSNFNQSVAGSYAIAVDFGAPTPVQALATLNADGGIIATDTDDFGFGIDQRFHSPKHGLWERSGKRSVTATVYEYAFLEEGLEGGNVPALVFRLTFEFTFADRTLTNGTGTVHYTAHLLPTLDPGADPLDPESGTIVGAGGGDVSFRRLGSAL